MGFGNKLDVPAPSVKPRLAITPAVASTNTPNDAVSVFLEDNRSANNRRELALASSGAGAPAHGPSLDGSIQKVISLLNAHPKIGREDFLEICKAFQKAYSDCKDDPEKLGQLRTLAKGPYEQALALAKERADTVIKDTRETSAGMNYLEMRIVGNFVTTLGSFSGLADHEVQAALAQRQIPAYKKLGQDYLNDARSLITLQLPFREKARDGETLFQAETADGQALSLVRTFVRLQEVAEKSGERLNYDEMLKIATQFKERVERELKLNPSSERLNSASEIMAKTIERLSPKPKKAG